MQKKFALTNNAYHRFQLHSTISSDFIGDINDARQAVLDHYILKAEELCQKEEEFIRRLIEKPN